MQVGSIGRIPELFDQKFEQRTVAFSFFHGTGSDRILGNDRGVGVPVFTNHRIKNTKKAKHARVTLSERVISYYVRKAKLLCNSINLDATQDMYKLFDKMSNGNGLQGLSC